MANVEILSENEVTKENIAELFKRAFMSTSFDSEGDLRVEIDGTRVLVFVDEDKKLLKYMALYRVKESIPLELKHALSNKMNGTLIFGRFLIPESRPDILIADYYLTYEGGIPVFQIISAFRLFAKVVTGAISACDDSSLLE